jgi:hypothetical protein
MFDLDAGFLIAGSDVDRSTNTIVLMSQFQQEVGNDRTMSWVTLIMAQVVPHPRSDTSVPFQGGKLNASEQQKIEPLTATSSALSWPTASCDGNSCAFFSPTTRSRE